jgi:hypothetical protein
VTVRPLTEPATVEQFRLVGDRLTLRIDLMEYRLSAQIDRSARGLMVWMSGMVLATGGLAFAAGRFV